MALQYDDNLMSAWRDKAITDLSKIVIGQTYHTNLHADPIEIKEILTTREMYIRTGLTTQYVSEPALEAAVFRVGDKIDSVMHYIHPADYNIGARYNPWMLFEKEEDARACRNELRVVCTYSVRGYDNPEDHENGAG